MRWQHNLDAMRSRRRRDLTWRERWQVYSTRAADIPTVLGEPAQHAADGAPDHHVAVT
jgi:hypothetical protein